MTRTQGDTFERRRAYVQRISTSNSLQDIYSDERTAQWEAFSSADKRKLWRVGLR